MIFVAQTDETRRKEALAQLDEIMVEIRERAAKLLEVMREDEWKARLEAAVLAEREACADVCDRIANLWPRSSLKEGWRKGYVDGGSACRNLIRERGEG